MAHRFPGRPPGSDNDTVVSSIHDYLDGSDFHRPASEFFDDDDSFWSLPDIQQRLQHQHQQHHPRHPHTNVPTMARFPGRPPGSADFLGLASDLFADDDPFWSLLEVRQRQQQQDQHRHQQQHISLQHHTKEPLVNRSSRPSGSFDFQRLAGEFFDDDDSFWSLPDVQEHQQQQQNIHQAQSTRPPVKAVTCLVPSQVYTRKTTRSRTNTRRCSSDSKPSSCRTHKDTYSKHNIQPYSDSVCSGPTKPSYGSSVKCNTPPHWGPTVEKDIYGTVIRTSKIWRQRVPTAADTSAHYSARLTTPGLNYTDLPSTVAPPAPVFRTSPAPPTSYPLKPSLSKDTCTTATTTTTTTTSSTLCVGIDGHHTGSGFGHSFVPFHTKPEGKILTSGDSAASVLATLHCHAFLYPSWVSLVLRQPSSFWHFHPLKNSVVHPGTHTEISFGACSAPDDFALALFQSLSVQHPFRGSFFLQRESSLWCFHQPAPKVYIHCRWSLFRWVAALIYKLLLIAWDLWQYKTDWIFDTWLVFARWPPTFSFAGIFDFQPSLRLPNLHGKMNLQFP